MSELHLQSIINYIATINWNSAGSVLFGAAISALISYWFSKWRENQLLKIEMQVKTADLLIDTVKTFNTEAVRMTSSSIVFLQNYNISLQYNQITKSKKNNRLGSSRITYELHKYQNEEAKENVRKSFNDYCETWIAYSNDFFLIISILESKEVILNKFRGFRYLLLDEFSKLGEMQNDFAELFHNDITQSVIHSQPIPDACLQKVDEQQLKFMEKCIDINCIIWDLQVGLQNEFLSKLFKYKVAERQVNDTTLPVYKPGFAYDDNTDKKFR